MKLRIESFEGVKKQWRVVGDDILPAYFYSEADAGLFKAVKEQGLTVDESGMISAPIGNIEAEAVSVPGQYDPELQKLTKEYNDVLKAVREASDKTNGRVTREYDIELKAILDEKVIHKVLDALDRIEWPPEIQRGIDSGKLKEVCKKCGHEVKERLLFDTYFRGCMC